ncbi:MAG: tripartite tricarboxylate transporter substrate binding protein [Betaproteobacteria bacterium]|nr:tripartite tricarboxylate transporter substrate binding protein [Betaproteobacteria bacterium]
MIMQRLRVAGDIASHPSGPGVRWRWGSVSRGLPDRPDFHRMPLRTSTIEQGGAMFMIRSRVKVTLMAATSALMLGLAGQASSQSDFPSRPIRLVIPTAAGGGFDILGRQVAQRLTEDQKVNMVVENRPGAGTITGTEHVARSTPDGYTLMLGGVSNIALNPALFRKLPYDAKKDFVPVGFLATYPTVFLVAASLPVNNLREFVSLVRDNPGKYNFATAGVGTAQHIWGEIVLKQLGLSMETVHYKGAAPAHQDMIAGRVHFTMENISAARGFIQAGRLKALGVSSTQRSPQLPDTPTLIETGLLDFEAGSWMAVFAPSATPPAVVEKLREAIGTLVRSPEYIARIQGIGGMPMNIAAAEQQPFMDRELARWDTLIRSTGIQLD